MVDGVCRLCGKNATLTKEHIPPQAAFNDARVLLHRMTRTPTGDLIRHVAGEDPHGAVLVVLCEKCNNTTGSIYGSTYVDFVKEVANRADGKRRPERVQFSVRTFPLRIVKQVLTMLCATSGALGPEAPYIRTLLLSRLDTGIPDKYRLFAFVPENRGLGRTTGVSAFFDLEERREVVLSETTWWPLGWILTLNGQEIRRGAEVTHWATESFKTRKAVDVDFPVLPALGDYGADFRTRAEILRDRRRNMGLPE